MTALGLGAIALIAVGSLRSEAVPTPALSASPSISVIPPRVDESPQTSSPAPSDPGTAATPVRSAQTTPAPGSPAPATPIASPNVGGVTRYVATTGSDTNVGTLDAPLLTVPAAVDRSAPGDTVVIRAGRYAGFDIAAQGRSDAPITIRNFVGEAPVIAGPAGRPDIIHVAPAARNVVLEGLTVQGSTAYRGSGVLIENVRDGPVVVRRCRLLGNAGFGINIYQSRNVLVEGNDISRNGTGVQVIGEGTGVVVSDNEVHENDRMIRNTRRSVDPNDDYGAVGVAMVRTVGAVVVSGNRVWGNRARSHDYGWDGGAFEIYGASNVTIRDNVALDNQNVLETGTDPGVLCEQNRFFRNLAYGHTTAGSSRGIILRCGAGMIIAYNTLANLDDYALDVGPDSPAFSGPIGGARVVGNIFEVSGGGTPYRVVGPRQADLTIDGNLVWAESRVVAYVAGRGRTKDLAQLSAWTGYERSGLSADPRFVSPPNSDYRLGSGSPAIDVGLVVPGITDGYVGPAPDLGAIERP
jgi:hypothetical protein